MEEFVLALAVKYPAVITVLAVVGTLRVIMKPLVSLAHAYVASTETKADDKLLDTVEHSKIYLAAMYLLDWLASVKVKPAASPAEPAQSADKKTAA